MQVKWATKQGGGFSSHNVGVELRIIMYTVYPQKNRGMINVLISQDLWEEFLYVATEYILVGS